MHMAEPEVGALGSNGIVGAGSPIACGAGLTIKLKNIPDRVSLAFFGDGAANEGAVHEAMNLAAAWSLPVIFVLINNGYGMSTPFEKAVKETDLTKRAAAYGMRSFECDGNDVLAVYETVLAARDRCVENREPVFIVENTYRMAGHSKSDDNFYRDAEEMALWKKRDPIERFANVLLKTGFAADELAERSRAAEKAVENAVKFSKNAPEPDVSAVLENV